MRPTPWLLAMGLTVSAAAPRPSPAADIQSLERFTAFAVNMAGGGMRSSTATVDIVIERWTTDEEHERALAALKEGGADDLLKALRKVEPRVGYIRTATSLAYPLRFARQIALPDGARRILLATDRRLSFMEASRSARTTDYPFMVVDMRIGSNGEGHGKLLPLARVQIYPDQVVEIESYDAEPVRLTRVKKGD